MVEEKDELESDGEPAASPVTLRVVNPGTEKAQPATAAATTRQDQPESPLRVKNPADRKKEAADREREELLRKMNEASPAAVEDYELPSLDLLLPSDDVNFEAQASKFAASQIWRRHSPPASGESR
jgi:hypothetical protein